MFGQLLPSKNKIATVPTSVAIGIRVPPNPVSKQSLVPKALFRYLNSPLNSTMQKEDSPSHQNVGTYMEY
jgi:hypothetical protein